MTYLDTLNDTNDVNTHVCQKFNLTNGEQVWSLTRIGRPLPDPTRDEPRLERLNDMNWMLFVGRDVHRLRCPWYVAAWKLRLAMVTWRAAQSEAVPS
jgi:hypothetical protein